MVSIIIVNYNSGWYLKSCVDSIMSNSDLPLELLIIDNNSTDQSCHFLLTQKNSRIHLIPNQTNLGFSKACNQGLNKACGDFFITMNPDILVPKGWLTRLLWHLHNNPRTLAVGPKGIGIGGEQSPGPLSFSSNLAAADRLFAKKYYHQSELTKFLIGCLLLFDKRLLKNIGYFDENLPLGADDFDLSLRVRQAGFELRIACDLLIHHFVHVSFNRSNLEESRRMESDSYKHFRQKWSKELQQYGWEKLFNDPTPIFKGEKPFLNHTFLH